MRRGAWTVLGVVLVTALAGWWLLADDPSAAPPSPEMESVKARETEAPEADAMAPLLRGRAKEASPNAVWLTVSVVEVPGNRPLGNTEFMFRLRLADTPEREAFLIARTDDDGTKRLGPLPSEDIEVLLGSKEHRNPPGWMRPKRDATGNLTLVVALERGLSVSGIVELPEGVPAQAVRLTLRMGNTHFTGIEVQDDGSFSRPGLDPGSAEVRVVAAHDGRRYFGRAETEVGAGTVTVRLVPARIGDPTFTRIRVEDPQGEPTAAVIEFEQASHDFRAWPGSTQVFGETEIEHEFHPRAGLFVFARPQQDSGLGETVVGPLPSDTTLIVVKLSTARSVQGRVVDASGSGVAGTSVTMAMVHPAPERTTATSRPSTDTDGSGAFECGGLGAHEYVMTVAVPPAFVRHQPRRVRPGTRNIQVVLEEGVAAQVTVLDADGSPVVDAAVTATITDGHEAMTVSTGTTDREGSCRLTGLAEVRTYRLLVRPPNARTDLLMVVKEGWSPGAAEVRLDRAHSISGHLRTSEGKPMTGVWVRCDGIDMPHGGALVLKQADGSTVYQRLGAQTGPDGSFTIRRLRDGRYELSADGLSDSKITVDAGTKNVNLVGPLMLDLHIKILDWNLGDRGKRLQMRVTGGSGNGLPRRIDADGRVSFGKVHAARTYDVWIGNLVGGRYVWAKSLSPSVETIEIQPQVGGTARGRLIAPEGVDLEEVTMLAGGAISGIVFPESGEIDMLGAFATKIDHKNGRFEVTGLPPGKWGITFWLQHGDEFYSAEVNIHAGDDIEVRLKKD